MLKAAPSPICKPLNKPYVYLHDNQVNIIQYDIVFAYIFIKNIMKIQAKIEAWNWEFEEFIILIKNQYLKIRITYTPIYKIKHLPISIPSYLKTLKPRPKSYCPKYTYKLHKSYNKINHPILKKLPTFYNIYAISNQPIQIGNEWFCSMARPDPQVKKVILLTAN